MSDHPSFKRPAEMKIKADERVPVSTRIHESTRDFLNREAEKNGLSLALLLSNVIEDYATWLRAESKKK
ncbi:hypothetical protein WDW86_00515 [Bdellovibrionota bacterium FG-2]